MQNKLLIVDDDKELLKMLKCYFELRGYLIYTAADGKAALEKMDVTPDLILLDINMPHISGIEVCKRIRNKVALLHNPEILIVDEPTTGLDPEERVRIRNLLVDFSKDRIVLFSTHVIEDLAAACNTLGILKKGNLIYSGKKDTLLNQASGRVWISRLKNEEEYNLLQNRYIISSKNYKEDGIEARIISDKQPDAVGIKAEVTLEDAYIYVMNSNKL